jgi:hypothetical protein
LWEADSDPPAHLLADVARHKAEVLAILTAEEETRAYRIIEPNVGLPPGSLALLRPGAGPAVTVSTTNDQAPTDLAELADWFTANADRLPQAPFGLVPGRRSGWAVWVESPARFYAALRTDLATGPSSARARTGALAADLRRLRALLGG